jgi:hypothetical protein
MEGEAVKGKAEEKIARGTRIRGAGSPACSAVERGFGGNRAEILRIVKIAHSFSVF